MSITILAVVFLILMLLITYFGYRFAFRKDSSGPLQATERCSLCRCESPASGFIERQPDDTRVYRFCETCIKSLYEELLSRDRKMG